MKDKFKLLGIIVKEMDLTVKEALDMSEWLIDYAQKQIAKVEKDASE